MKPTDKQMKYLEYAIHDFDRLFGWFKETENKQIRYSQVKNKFMDIISRAFFTGTLTREIASQIIGAHIKHDIHTIRKIIENLDYEST